MRPATPGTGLPSSHLPEDSFIMNMLLVTASQVFFVPSPIME
jgi:hypothetical protein